MWRGRLFFLCLALALLSGCAPGGPVAEAGADAQLPADKLIAITFDDGPPEYYRAATGRPAGAGGKRHLFPDWQADRRQ